MEQALESVDDQVEAANDVADRKGGECTKTAKQLARLGVFLVESSKASVADVSPECLREVKQAQPDCRIWEHDAERIYRRQFEV